ncbi:M20 family metallopeptidase [Cryptosporangium phraense]|uniref:M20 family metallopeptidase n=1 Tax=Cryptosporangium phraense TaxID=2593070 RepID=A0A545AWJ0_9ACTN|nr:M20 family metallopeptidase [Cryptosporangium phraense]TQS45694.1 M20 family metallopeptidase [Cryptosporangium phraense]
MLAELAGTASPHGGERALAERFAAWAARRWPSISWQVRPLDDGSASVLASAGGPAEGSGGPARAADLVLYSHLDTSLTGDPARDAAITGRADAPPPFEHDGDTVTGFGLGVAKAPAAAAVAGFVRAAPTVRGTAHLLLAARGTHRAGHGLTGVGEYLQALPRPAAAVVAKGGPPGVLRQEPGALYLLVRLSAGWGPLMLHPGGGLLSQAAGLLSAVSTWGSNYVADVRQQAIFADPSRPDGASFGLGALRAGSPEKADLTPSTLELVGYLVLPGPIEPGAAAASLRAHLAEFDGVEVDEQLLGDGPGTPADAPIVRAATAAYEAEFGPAEPIRNWTGSTDGVVFRAAGVSTARLGPRPLPPGDDPRIDRFSVAALTQWARVYEKLVASFVSR